MNFVLPRWMLTKTSLSRNQVTNASEVLNSPQPAYATQSTSRGSRRVGTVARDNLMVLVKEVLS